MDRKLSVLGYQCSPPPDRTVKQPNLLGPGKLEPDLPRASVIRATTDSPMSPPPLASIAPPLSRAALSRSGSIYNTQRTLLEIFTSQDKGKSRPEFVGRQGDSLAAKLYPNLKTEDRGPREGMEVE
ncbi:hypothetical protein NQ318_016685 [Aromia moschata]|uniref:Uncharacterized protein n=1 Tax=Aromia moschata TaxID=1265417 RepID=A0AAV8Y1F5_9CUCU|nr:hypothetical protein NQ318_016685 [Aromia moschata]